MNRDDIGKGTVPRRARRAGRRALALLVFAALSAAAAGATRDEVETDWLRQAGGNLDARPAVAGGLRLAAALRTAGVDTRAAESELAAVTARLEILPADAPPAARREVYLQARRAVRRLALANPLLSFDRLLVVKRFTQESYPDVCLNHMPWASRPGGDVCVVSRWKDDGSPDVRPLLKGRLGPGHVHGADLWWDGDRVVFGYAKAKTDQPPAGWLDRATSYGLRRSEEPTHIFEVKLDGTGLRQITRGEWSDLDPTYLPSGDIAFVSERCACSLQCNELDKDETSCNLYVMHPDGSDIRRLSATKDGDYLPHAFDDGTIGYTRWEYQERGWANIQSIWTVRPDGTGADAVFKQHFNDPWALEDTRSIPGSRKLVAIATGHHCLAAGPVVVIDARKGMNSASGITIVTPGVKPPEGGMSGIPAPEGGVRDQGGYYMTPSPLSETTFLAAYTYGPQNDPAGYGIYLVDVFGTKELLYRDPAISCSIPAPLRPRPRPPILPDLTDRSQSDAVCSLANVGRGVDGVAPGAARYLRIAEGLYWPYDNADGGQRYEPDVKSVMINWNPVRILGEVPIEADGSAHFRVPADTPVYFQLLDADHMELRRMRSFISFQAGEQRGCTGCHESREETPASRITPLPMAMVRAPSIPVPPVWGDRAVSFLRDVQPVFDRRCTPCHAGLKPAGGLDFSGGLTASYNRAYDTLSAKKLVAWSNVGDDARVTQPLAFGSHQSKLVQVLRDGSCAARAKLDRDDWLRLVTWIDANAPYHDGFINKRTQPQPYDLPNDRELAAQVTSVHARRCTSCHQPAEVSRLDWVDLKNPRQSRFLAAPLAGGRCSSPVYKDPSDPDYRALAALVETAVKKAWDFPRRDLKALPRP